jgi:hypothetical protein
MAKIVLKDAYISVDSVELSDHCSSVTIETTFDEQDVTGFGSTYREFLQGLGDATITLALFQDFDTGSVDDTLWPLSQSGETFDVVVRATSAIASATNPEYTMTGSLFNYNPIAGEVGNASTTDVSIRNASSTGLVRSTGV